MSILSVKEKNILIAGSIGFLSLGSLVGVFLYNSKTNTRKKNEN
jgi:hypothetical protein